MSEKDEETQDLLSISGHIPVDQDVVDSGQLLVTEQHISKRIEHGAIADAAQERASVTQRIALVRQHVGQPEDEPPSIPPHYILEASLGEGGMGLIYEAGQTSLNRRIALKMMRPELQQNREMRNDFLNEVLVTGSLEHPNIVPIHEVAVNEDGQIYFAMKCVRGQDWDQVIKKKTTEQNLDIMMKVMDAITFAHSRGVIHRDIKPQNVMLGDYGEVLVMDWGLAVGVHEGAMAEMLNYHNALAGTPAYMAPEMAKGDERKIGFHSDVYLLGALLFEILTGGPPRQGKDNTELMTKAANNVIRKVFVRKRQELLKIARKAMATKPVNRYHDVASFKAAIRDYQAHQESIAETDNAEDMLEKAHKNSDYDAYAQALFAFHQARRMWPDNERACCGEAQVVSQYAECAYARGDLDLAASLLDPAVADHAVMLKRIDKAERDRRARRKRIRILQVGACGMAALVILALSVAFFSIRIARGKASRALADYTSEQARRAHERARSAPVFLKAARKALGELNLAAAQVNADLAIQYLDDPSQPLMLKAQILLARQEFEQAATVLKAYLERNPKNARANKMVNLCVDMRNPKLRKENREALASMLMQQGAMAPAMLLSSNDAKLISGISSAIKKRYKLHRNPLYHQDDGLFGCIADCATIENLTCFAGVPLVQLKLTYNKNLTDLGAVSKMPLLSLILNKCERVTDLSPLKGLPLQHLHIEGCPQINDISALRDMPLTTLVLNDVENIQDLSPLTELPLTSFSLNRNDHIEDLGFLAGAKLNALTVIKCNRLTDISTLRNMPLELLSIQYCEQLKDYAPLSAKTTLREIALARSTVKDLDWLRDSDLKKVDLHSCMHLNDIDGLSGLAITSLNISVCSSLMDLSPLRGMPLKQLTLKYIKYLEDLSVLNSLELEELSVSHCAVRDLEPLADMKSLKSLSFHSCSRLVDLTPLKALALERFAFEANRIEKGVDVLRSMKSLQQIKPDERIDWMEPASFWTWYDKRRNSLSGKDKR